MSKGHHTSRDEQVLKSINVNKIILPVALGILVLIYMVFRQFNFDEFQTIKWNQRLWTYLGLAVGIYICRHIFYALRLKLLSGNAFTFRHSVELITIWEFASAISPTSLGGSAAAVFFLSQEKISGAKAVSIVMYTVIVDTLFFLLSLLFLLALIGPQIIRPGMDTLFHGYGITFMVVWLFMFAYGAILLWGLYRPRIIKYILHFLARLPLIKRFKKPLIQTGMDVVTTSNELRSKPFSLHVKTAALTIGAWVSRFLTVNFVILALVEMDWNWWEQLVLYARSETMYVITQFSPTPGGSGVMEFMFSGFFTDFISSGLGSVGALLWRMITYYPYLIIGAIIIPNWIRRIIKHKSNK